MNNQLRSSKQIAASRVNGSKSKGPVSDAGKAKSSQNAVKHGLRSTRVVLANESQEKYDRMLADFRREWNPVGVTENALLVEMVNARWRIRRIQSIETAILDMRMFQQLADFDKRYTETHPGMREADALRAIALSNPYSLEYLERAEIRLSRIFDRAMQQLTRLQTARLGHPPVLETQVDANEPAAEDNNYEEPETFAWISRVVSIKERIADPETALDDPGESLAA